MFNLYFKTVSNLCLSEDDTIQRGRTAVKVSTTLRLGLGPDIVESQEADPCPSAQDNLKHAQHSRKSKSKMSSGGEKWQTVEKNHNELTSVQKQLREEEHYAQLLEREHYQLQDTIKYYKVDVEKERLQMQEQLVNQRDALDDAYLEIHKLKQENALLRAETRRLNDLFLARDRERESQRKRLHQQQKVNMEQTCEISTLSSKLKLAQETIMASLAATRVQRRNIKKGGGLAPYETMDSSSAAETPRTSCPHSHRTMAVSSCSHCGNQFESAWCKIFQSEEQG